MIIRHLRLMTLTKRRVVQVSALVSNLKTEVSACKQLQALHIVNRWGNLDNPSDLDERKTSVGSKAQIRSQSTINQIISTTG